jgi:hypothetical protein
MSFGERALAALLGLGIGKRYLVLGLYRRGELRDQRGRLRQTMLVALKPVTSWRRADAFVRKHGAALREQYGVSPLRQRFTLAWAAFRHSARPDPGVAYWAFAVDRPDKWNCWVGDVQSFVLNGDLNARCAPRTAHRINDKREFADWARASAIPDVPLIATVVDGRWDGGSFEALARSLPDSDLFAKPADGGRGIGARRWLRAAPGRWTDQEGREVEGDAIVASLARDSVSHPMILQRALRPHPALAALAPNAVSTVRFVTYEDAQGEPQALRASLRLPAGDAIVDNAHAGGMFAAIDLATGRLGKAIRRRPDGLLEPSEELNARPGFAETLVDIWPAVLALALAAQRAAAPVPFLGWDIALSAEGPRLLEGNNMWDGCLVTLSHEVPLGETPFPDEFLRHWFGGNRERSGPSRAEARSVGSQGSGVPIE